MVLRQTRPQIDPEQLAVDALGFLAADPERIERFVALTGIDPGDLRRAVGEPAFLAAILEHLMGDEPLLLAFAAERAIRPEAVAEACRRLAGPSEFA